MLMKLLIVTERIQFFHLCENSFSKCNIYACRSSSKPGDIEALMGETNPDILLLDSENGDQALEELHRLIFNGGGRKPALFVCLGNRTAAFEWNLLRRGVTYVFDQQMLESQMADCIINLVLAKEPVDRKERVTPELVRILRQCCISPRHRGYARIFESVEMLFYQGDSGQRLTKGIYPEVAKKQGATPSRVEKNIRDAIRGGWENGGQDVMPSLLGCGRDKPPTNGEFISSVCERMLEIACDADVQQKQTVSAGR